MFENIKKVRIPAFTAGVILFLILTCTTMIELDLDEEYIGYQLFRSHFITNRFILGAAPSSEVAKQNANVVIDELDLIFHVFMDSSLFTVYRYMDKEYGNVLNSLENRWLSFVSNYKSNSLFDNYNVAEVLEDILNDVNEVEDYLTFLEHWWHILYSIVLSLNLLIFISLLIIVFLRGGKKDISGSPGIMSVRNALIEGQEKERLRISLELHDKVAQDLFACKMLLNDLSNSIENEILAPIVKKSTSLLDTSIKEVRDLSYSLRPPALQAIGLDSAIKSYIDNFAGKVETPITFKAIGVNNKTIDETVSINLYRILQETLNNTAKHAHAQNIDVKLIYTYPYLLLKIEDDGVGFKYVKSDVKAKGRNQLGLPGINERVSLLGGELIINTNKGEGTKILIKVPIVRNEKV